MREFSSRRSELGRTGEYGEFGRESSEDFGRKMAEDAERISRALDSILNSNDDVEIDREGIYGIDQEAVRKEESREFKLSSNQNSEDEKIDSILERLRRISGNNTTAAKKEHDDELKRMISELPTIEDDNSKHL